TVGAPHRRRIAIDRTTELLILPASGQVAPYDARRSLNRKPLEPGVVLVGDRVALGLRNHDLTNQIDSFEDVVLEAPLEDAERHARERDLDPCAVGLHLAAAGLVHH